MTSSENFDDFVETKPEDEWKDDDFLQLDQLEDDDEKKQHAQPKSVQPEEPPLEVDDEDDDDDDLPPWMHRPHDMQRVHPTVSLHNEIVAFHRLMEPLPAEIQRRQDLVEEIRQLVDETFGTNVVEVQVFGSLATGLLLPTSDIDLVLLRKDEEEDGKQNSSKATEEERQRTAAAVQSQLLQRLLYALRSSSWIRRLSYLEAIENTRIPLIKFTDRDTDISVDVSFQSSSGPPAAVLMTTYLQALPPLRPLTFVLKYFLAARGLNEPYSGGVGSYMLQLLIVAFLQHRERLAYNEKLPVVNNLGVLLVEFFQLYGLDFNYFLTVISVRNDGFFFPKGERPNVFWNEQRPNLLALENPLDPTQDVGKGSFRIALVQKSFALAYRTLMAHVTGPLEPTSSILGTILPVNREMMGRRYLKSRGQSREASKRRNNGTSKPSVDRPLSAKRGRRDEGDGHRRKRSRRK